MDNNKLSYKIIAKETVSLAVYNVGSEQCLPRHQWGPGVRDHYLIHHIVSGKGTYTVDNVTYQLKAGDTFIIYPLVEVSYCADEFEPWEYHWVGFAGSDAKLLLSYTNFSSENLVISTNFNGALCNALKDIYSVIEQNNNACGGNGSLVKMTGKLYIMLSVLIDNADVPETDSDLNLLYATKASEFVAHNFSQNISIQDIADFIGVSRGHLYRVFMEHYDMSPKKFLSDFRIKQACMLLKTTALSVGAIANSVGFEDNLYFSKMFKKIVSLTPIAYRNGEPPQKNSRCGCNDDQMESHTP